MCRAAFLAEKIILFYSGIVACSFIAPVFAPQDMYDMAAGVTAQAGVAAQAGGAAEDTWRRRISPTSMGGATGACERAASNPPRIGRHLSGLAVAIL